MATPVVGHFYVPPTKHRWGRSEDRRLRTTYGAGLKTGGYVRGRPEGLQLRLQADLKVRFYVLFLRLRSQAIPGGSSDTAITRATT